MGRKQPRRYRKRAYRYPAPSFNARRMNNLMYDAAGLSLGVGVLGAIVQTSANLGK